MQMHPAPPPIEVSGRSFAQELERARVRHRQVRIREVGEREHGDDLNNPR
jgi:hypothetical protein